jgi:O-methyltransferase
MHGPYETLAPQATYAPWIEDERFQEVFAVTRDHSLVDLYRSYELWQLVEQVRALPGALLEVGVWRGGTGALIARRAADLGIDAPVYLCDTFAGVVKSGDADPHYRDGMHADAGADGVRALLASLGVPETVVLTGIFPDDTGGDVVAAALRLCHIDVDVYASARDVLEWAWPRLAVGGVVVFDDHGFASCPGVTRLVEEQRPLPGRLVVHNLNGHGILVKLAA